MGPFRPYPFGALVTRMFRELEQRESIFDLPAAAFARSETENDFAVSFHGRRASTPFGPAAGPHTQLAQNIVLSWLAGGRIIELKTVQVRDDLTIPRPCIDARTVGFNIEWSQELTIEQALEEYVKAAMLVRILAASGRLPARGVAATDADATLFDISVGYDLAGITSPRVRAFIERMTDAGRVIDRLRRQIPAPWQQFADLPFEPRVSESVTLSTFHGCPADEIGRILEFLLRDAGLDSVLKVNPTLLGAVDTRALLHDVLGYTTLCVPDAAFAQDLQWDAMCDIVERADRLARSLDRSFGVKFCNTLVVENEGEFLPASAPEKYLSGAPLHVLAMELVRRFRRRFGARVPLSFSGGIDQVNFADAVALGLTPITACTDLLKAGGYARGHKYLQELGLRMRAVSAATVGDFIVSAHGQGTTALGRLGLDEPVRAQAARALGEGGNLRAAVGDAVFARWVAEAALLNTERYARACAKDPRYTYARNSHPPRKVGRTLTLFECLTCDKCVPVCPNDANFAYPAEPTALDVVKVWREDSAWRHRIEGSIPAREPVQIGNFADLCNSCGNCDVFCPEDGGPYRLKPRFFGTAAAWHDATPQDGFYVARLDGRECVFGRFAGREYRLNVRRDHVLYSGDGFVLTFDEADPLATLEGQADAEVDLTYFFVMNHLRKSVLAPGTVNFVNCER